MRLYVQAVLKFTKLNTAAQQREAVYGEVFLFECVVSEDRYLRKSRKLRLLTGPPFHKESDAAFAELARDFDGKIVLCGGTTAKIVSRELNRKIEFDNKLLNKGNGLPPPSEIHGIDLVTEGILTLTDVVQRIERGGNALAGALPLASKKLIELLRNSYEIDIIVGTKVNESHQHHNLPINLEIRRNIIKRLKTALEEKYHKHVSIRFF
ncbi:MAG: hypothetical protein LBK06_05675 [Planctomycetaceae bacterium]|nr:hypothetical protein [Planctomycetaceae bacterium]